MSVQESGVENVACPDGVLDLSRQGGRLPSLPSTQGNASFRPSLDDHEPAATTLRQCLRRLGSATEVVHLQQSDQSGDHHWPFTDEKNRDGRIEAERVLSALDASGAEQVALILEVIPAFEAADDQVLRDLETSVRYWQSALERNAS